MDETTPGTPRRQLLKGAAGIAAGAAAVSVLSGGSMVSAATPGMSMTLQDVGTFEVAAWSWGASQVVSVGSGGGGSAGKASFQDLSVTRYTDPLTPLLLQRLATGAHIPTGRLDITTKDLVQTFELDTILVSSLSTGASSSADRQTENLTVVFAKFKYTVGPNFINWDVGANTGG